MFQADPEQSAQPSRSHIQNSSRLEAPSICKRRGRPSASWTTTCPTRTSTGPTPRRPEHQQRPPSPAGRRAPPAAQGPWSPLHRGRLRLGRLGALGGKPPSREEGLKKDTGAKGRSRPDGWGPGCRRGAGPWEAGRGLQQDAVTREGPGAGAGRSGAAGGPYPDRISLAEEGWSETGGTERSRNGLDCACAAAGQLAGRGHCACSSRSGRRVPSARARRPRPLGSSEHPLSARDRPANGTRPCVCACAGSPWAQERGWEACVVWKWQG